MGQKVHPLGFRLGVNKKHQSTWFTTSKKYPIFIEQDTFLRALLFKNYAQAGISGIEIERKVNQVWVTLRATNPRILVGKGQGDLETIRKDIEKQLHKHMLKNIFTQKKYEFFKNEYVEQPTEVAIFITKLANQNADVMAIAQSLVTQLEQRIPFRRAMRQVVQQAQKQKVQGIKIQISGRLNGAEIARSEWVREGRVPLQTLRANIDYSYTTAKTIYGLLGIKIWVFHDNENSVTSKIN
uniref:ribosomal protein S3 n=1 Tax=Tetraselmis marina TaxID=41888 RepID=UPI0021ACFF83|nr:ribosomal protein S3 [Tetraselmis marina]UUA64536.1 ribosomal protein S3 [Tetraselmis marina]